MDSIKHMTIIEEKVYTDKLKTVIMRNKQKLLSSDSTLILDYMKCLSPITDRTTDELDVSIKRTPSGELKITKTWKVSKEQV